MASTRAMLEISCRHCRVDAENLTGVPLRTLGGYRGFVEGDSGDDGWADIEVGSNFCKEVVTSRSSLWRAPERSRSLGLERFLAAC